ncbi:MAG TPA: dihydroorotase [Hypericibacter adhaerens]|jgi:dihydroorotase|uniref:dihydroorotase n=1 Tax=Hypericibacter adhaerens TaxID=2602016 RepID=UPI002BE6071A|nr:dihydroorotase [Hypericibacter adhaerens]HWA45493.1 dihydroorotase [Hypericibacter adhaerens]
MTRGTRQPPRPTAFLNARLIDPTSGYDGPGGLLVIDGEIADLGPDLGRSGLPADAIEINCNGHCLVPGLVDMRVQLREPGEEHKETIATASEAAAAGGITSMVTLPNSDPVLDQVAGVEFIARRARETKGTKVYCYGAVTRGLEGQHIVELGLLAENGALGFTDGTKAVASARVLRRAMSYASTFDLLILQHPEEPDLASGGVMNGGELATRLGLPGIPRDAEVMMIERDLHLVAMTGARYHVAHVSTADSVAAIRAAKARGLKVTCDTAPPYFILTEAEVGDYRTFAKLSPPLRGESDRAAIAQAVADGTIDAIASDHAPHDQESKRVPFAHAEFGIVGLETLLPLSLELVHQGRLPMIELIRRLSTRPADILRLPQGRLAKGAPADLLLFDPEAKAVIEVDRFRSKSKNSPFDGRPVKGHVLRTLVDGRTVYEAYA